MKYCSFTPQCFSSSKFACKLRDEYIECSYWNNNDSGISTHKKYGLSELSLIFGELDVCNHRVFCRHFDVKIVPPSGLGSDHDTVV